MTFIDSRPRAALARSVLLLLSSLALSATASAASPIPQQGQNIGNPIGRSGLFPLLATPPGNPFTAAPGQDYVPLPGSHTDFLAALGLALFWDEQLSSDKTTACATCHAPEAAGVDGRGSFLATNNGFGSKGVMPQDQGENYIAGTPTAQQLQVTGVIAPTMINAAFAESLFWDLRAGPTFPMALPQASQFVTNAALEAQAVGPPVNSTEMGHFGSGPGVNMSWAEVEAELNDARVLALATPATIPPSVLPFVQAGLDYRTFFDVVFNMPTSTFPGTLGVTRERVAVAIATYERTLISNQAPIDTRPMTLPERAGFDILVFSQCFRCHSDQPVFFGNTVPVPLPTGGFTDAMDAMLTDNRLHGNIGFPSPPGATGSALGSVGVKTPSLRNVALKPRLGHNGFFTSLGQLLAFYNRQLPGSTPTFPLRSIPSGGQLDDIELGNVMAFFDALTDPRLIPATPGARLPFPFWHPDLYADRVPLGSNEPATHPGTPSSPGATVPDLILQVPMLGSGNTHFKVGLRDAPAGGLAVIGMSPLALPPTPFGPLMLDTNGLTTATVGVTDPQGFLTAQFPTTGGVLPGQTFTFQWAVLDPANGGIAWSNAGTAIVQ